MGLFKKKMPEQEIPAAETEHDTSVGTAADVEAVMKSMTGSPTPVSGRGRPNW